MDLFETLKQLRDYAVAVEASDLGMERDESESPPELPPALTDDELRVLAAKLEANATS